MFDPFYDLRFYHYARVHNHSPEEQYRFDLARFQTATLSGYTFWLQSKIAEYSELNPSAFFGATLCDTQAFHDWLASLPCEAQAFSLKLASNVYPPSLA